MTVDRDIALVDELRGQSAETNHPKGGYYPWWA